MTHTIEADVISPDRRARAASVAHRPPRPSGRKAWLAGGLALSALPVVLGACGSSKSASGGANSAGASSTTAAGAANVGAGGSSGSQSLTATETEYHITLSRRSVAAGTWTFSVRNAGHATHDLVVDGPGVEDRKTALLSPGQSASLTVELKAGTYDIYCGVPGHKAAGMDTKLTVS